MTALALGMPAVVSCETGPVSPRERPKARIGISGGTQTLWRYLVRKRDQLLTSLGRDVELRTYPTEAELGQAFMANQIEIAATLPPALPSFVQSGVDAQYFLPASWIKEGYMFITANESPIRTMTDLVGRNVAVYPLSHPGFAYWLAFLPRNYGISIDQMQYRESESPESALLAGEVQAACVGSAQWSGLKGGQQFRKISDLYMEWRKISGSDELLMFGGYMARRDYIDKNKGFIDEFIRINYEVLKTYQADKPAFVEAISGDQIAPSLTKEQNEFIAWYLGLDDVAPERVYISDRDVAGYEQIYPLLSDVGYLKQAPSSVAKLFYRSGRKP